MLGPSLFSSPCGLSDSPTTGDLLLSAWDDFLAVVDAVDLSQPSRLPGLTGRDLCVHLGTWDDHLVLAALVATAAEGGGPEHTGATDHGPLIAAHAGEDVRTALQRSRDELARWLATPSPLATALVRSSVGDLPLLSLLNAGSYELAVHALDLAGSAPPDSLLQAGLAALMDVTGRLAAKHGVALPVTAQTPTGGWSFTSSTEGWTVAPVPPGRYQGVGVRGTAADLLDVSAGRANLPALLVQRRLVVQQLSQFMKLAPIVSEVPGLPGGAALRAGVSGVSAVTGGIGKVLGRLRR